MAGVCEGECMGCCLGNDPLTLTRCIAVRLYSFMKLLKGVNPSVAKPTTYEYKGENFIFSYLLALLIFSFRSRHGMMRADLMTPPFYSGLSKGSGWFPTLKYAIQSREQHSNSS